MLRAAEGGAVAYNLALDAANRNPQVTHVAVCAQYTLWFQEHLQTIVDTVRNFPLLAFRFAGSTFFSFPFLLFILNLMHIYC